ncbi:MAG TPA: FHA domain-containing protein, partial [Gemmatimonadales bacterium]|nr:FHA domain-containing protein [Gemmatimonadales bacterium]
MTAQFKFLSGARAGQLESFRKAYIGLGRHPLSDVRFDAERDLDVSARHAGIVRHGETFVVRDLGSTNGTFVNGARITGEVMLADGDVITFGQNGPAVEFRILSGDVVPDTVSDGTRASAERMSAPREQYAAVSAPRRSSTAMRIAVEVARQTSQLRRTTKLLIGILVLTLAAFTWTQWQTRRDARELAQLQARADSLAGEAQRLLARFQTELASLREALRESQAEVARLSTELAAAGSNGDARAIARLRAELDVAETRQRGLAGAAAMDYRAISLRNQDAVAMVVVQFSDTEIVGGTA